MTPYTTRTGVKIGILYETPKAPSGGPDMERLQRALLRRPRRVSVRLASRIVYYAVVFLALLTIVGMT